MVGTRRTVMGASARLTRMTPFFVIAFLSGAQGCGEERFNAMPTTESAVGSVSDRVTPVAADQAPSPGGEGPTVPSAVPRKIIYNAQLTLVVESVSEVGEKLTRLVKQSGGYVAETDQSSFTRTQRRTMWKVRIPVERFEPFLNEVSRMGELQQNHVGSQDVTQEFYDLESRISNKQKEEKRLLKHLEDSTGKLEDILSVERELTRVRGEVEQLQGRLRYLANFSALSTVTINAVETRDYAPPVAPTFAIQVWRAFRGSLDHIANFVKGLILVAVATLPWIPVFAVIGLPFWFVIRRRRNAQRPT